MTTHSDNIIKVSTTSDIDDPKKTYFYNSKQVIKIVTDSIAEVLDKINQDGNNSKEEHSKVELDHNSTTNVVEKEIPKGKLCKFIYKLTLKANTSVKSVMITADAMNINGTVYGSDANISEGNIIILNEDNADPYAIWYGVLFDVKRKDTDPNIIVLEVKNNNLVEDIVCYVSTNVTELELNA